MTPDEHFAALAFLVRKERDEENRKRARQQSVRAIDDALAALDWAEAETSYAQESEANALIHDAAEKVKAARAALGHVEMPPPRKKRRK